MLAPASAQAQSGGSVQPRIVGGAGASIATYPWQAAVVFSPAKRPGKDEPQREFCGGELITSRIVMTAGHCVADSVELAHSKSPALLWRRHTADASGLYHEAHRASRRLLQPGS